MITHIIHQVSYPKALLLLSISILCLLWLIYFLHYSIKNNWHTLRTIYYPYVMYTFFVILWVLTNAYFHTGWLVEYGETGAIIIAKTANIASYMSYSSAFHFSCRLRSSRKNNKIHFWQFSLLLVATLYSLYANIFTEDTVTGVTIRAPSDFTIHFGSLTAIFFSTSIIFTSLSFFNLLYLSFKGDNLKRLKSTYMVIGMVIFMTSTVLIHILITYIYHDFSLTWLPPALAISELLLMGYAVLCHRFYSWRYLYYISLTAIISTLIYVIPIVIFYHESYEHYVIFISLWCLLCGITWQKTWSTSAQIISLIIYNDSTPPSEKISSLDADFQKSISQAIDRLAQILNLSKDDITLNDNIRHYGIYTNYLLHHSSPLLIEEIEQHISNSDNYNLRKIHEQMSKDRSAVIIPLYDAEKSVSQLFMSPHKNDGSLYSNEEIHALQKLLKNSQIYINYQSRINQSQAMAKSIAHEMRNPLAQVQLHLENLANFSSNMSLSTEIKNEIQRGIDAVQHGNQLIDIILREVNQTLINHKNMATFSITELLNFAINDFAYESEETKDRVKIKSDIDFKVHVNKTLFDFIIFNLLRNAIYYFDDYSDSKIELSLEAGDEYNKLTFTDYGPGIEPQIVHRIFDEFFTYQKKGGSGLGLSYCKRAMKLFGGDIQCQSVYGEYTRFTLTFPHIKQEEQLAQPKIDVAEAPTPELLQSAHTVSASQKQRIALVTDDNSTQRALAKLYLESLHFTVYEAENGKEAVDMVHHNTIDIVFMDVQMPVMDGLKACTIIKETHPTLPILALSGESGEDEIAQIKRTMDGWLIKPTTKQLLQQTVLKWLEEDSLQAITPKPQTNTIDTL